MGRTDTLTLELYVRSLSADAGTASVGDVLDRLDRLDANDDIDGYDVTVWGDGVSFDERVLATDAARTIRDAVEECRAWAAEGDRSLPGFDERTTECVVTGETHHNISVPTMALVERHDDDVAWVAPCHDGRAHTVLDRLDRLGEADGRDTSPMLAEADD